MRKPKIWVVKRSQDFSINVPPEQSQAIKTHILLQLKGEAKKGHSDPQQIPAHFCMPMGPT